MKTQIFVFIFGFIEPILSTHSEEISNEVTLQEIQDSVENVKNKTVSISNLHKKYVPVPELPAKVIKLPPKVIKLRPKVLKLGIEVFSEEPRANLSIFPSNITIETPSEILQDLGILKLENMENSAEQNIISTIVYLSCIKFLYTFTIDT